MESAGRTDRSRHSCRPVIIGETVSSIGVLKYNYPEAIAGTGCAIVKKFVDIHGGTIDVRSEEREGTTFTVKLPGSAD
ncbi:MAG: ATP-binding protein [Hormoscilla sp. GM7CHS1pb]|nr:ATP-binding protein [Hormoscilla sp. GM7CHS1pb]